MAVIPIKERLARLRQRALDRVRDEPNLDWLVAQGLQLGKQVHIGHPIYFDRNRPWLITIEDYVDLSAYAAVITHDDSLHNYTGLTRIGRVIVGKRVMVGLGAIILPGTRIGEDSVVAAGAVVHGDIPPGSMVVGNPATVSSIKGAAAWNRASAARSPNWPQEGWSMYTGITEERKREQRDALADCVSGYVPARAAPDSPHAVRQRKGATSRPKRVASGSDSATSGSDTATSDSDGATPSPSV